MWPFTTPATQLSNAAGWPEQSFQSTVSTQSVVSALEPPAGHSALLAIGSWRALLPTGGLQRAACIGRVAKGGLQKGGLQKGSGESPSRGCSSRRPKALPGGAGAQPGSSSAHSITVSATCVEGDRTKHGTPISNGQGPKAAFGHGWHLAKAELAKGHWPRRHWPRGHWPRRRLPRGHWLGPEAQRAPAPHPAGSSCDGSSAAAHLIRGD